jgi:hypothetical protein
VGLKRHCWSRYESEIGQSRDEPFHCRCPIVFLLVVSSYLPAAISVRQTCLINMPHVHESLAISLGVVGFEDAVQVCYKTKSRMHVRS